MQHQNISVSSIHRCEVSSWFRFYVRVSLQGSVRNVYQKPKTRNQLDTYLFSLYKELFSPKTAGPLIFGPPSDMIRGYTQLVDPLQVHSLAPNTEICKIIS